MPSVFANMIYPFKFWERHFNHMSKTNPILYLQCILQVKEVAIWFISLEVNVTLVKTQLENVLVKLCGKV